MNVDESHTNPKTPAKQFCFVLIPGFSMVAFSCAIDALRAANHVIETSAYAWEAVSAESHGVTSSSGISLPTSSLNNAVEPDVIAICGGDRSHDYSNPELTRWIQSKAKQGKIIGSMSDGAFVAADIGLYRNVPSTIHWKCFDAYRERYPELDIRPSMIEISGNRFSCAGGTASLDLILHFINHDFGSEVVSRIADNYFHDTIREISKVQHMTNAYRIAGKNKDLSEALLLMENNLEVPLAIEEISGAVGVSRRQLDRLFKRFVDSTPQAHYRELRLSRASGLLIQTGLSITEIALGCGFHSASHLGKFFKQRFGVTPGEFRRSGYR